MAIICHFNIPGFLGYTCCLYRMSDRTSFYKFMKYCMSEACSWTVFCHYLTITQTAIVMVLFALAGWSNAQAFPVQPFANKHLKFTLYKHDSDQNLWDKCLCKKGVNRAGANSPTCVEDWKQLQGKFFTSLLWNLWGNDIKFFKSILTWSNSCSDRLHSMAWALRLSFFPEGKNNCIFLCNDWLGWQISDCDFSAQLSGLVPAGVLETREAAAVCSLNPLTGIWFRHPTSLREQRWWREGTP